MGKLRTIFALSWRERLMLLDAGATVVGVRAALYLLPFSVLRQHLSREVPIRTDASATDEANQLARFVIATSRWVPRATCLTQAMSLHRLLAQRGIDSTLCIGVGRDEQGAFRAHAWIDRQNKILVGGGFDLAKLTALPPLQPKRSAGGASQLNSGARSENPQIQKGGAEETKNEVVKLPRSFPLCP